MLEAALVTLMFTLAGVMAFGLWLFYRTCPNCGGNWNRPSEDPVPDIMGDLDQEWADANRTDVS